MERVLSKNFESILTLVKPNTCLVIDETSAELIHWSIDTKNLFDAGVIDIKSFSSFSFIPPYAKTLLFIIVDTVISKSTYPVISDIVKNSPQSVENVEIVTPFSENFHASVKCNVAISIDKFDKIRMELRALSKKYVNVNIHHIPLLCCFIDESLGLFVSPLMDDFFNIQLADKNYTKDQSTTSSVLEQLPEETQLKIKQFCGNFWRLLVDIEAASVVSFHIGKLSRIISEHLATIPLPKSANEKCSVVFVDRATDLTGPFHHSEKCFADELLKKFPNLSKNSSDVLVPVNNIILKHIKINGSLADNSNEIHQNLLRKVFTGKRKEVQNASYRILLDICSKQKVEITDKSPKPSFENVKKVLQAIESNRNVLENNLGIICLVIAVWLASKEDMNCEERIKLQKTFVQQYYDVMSDGKSFTHLLIDLIKQLCGSASVSCRDIIGFVISSISIHGHKYQVLKKDEIKSIVASIKNFKFQSNCTSCKEDHLLKQFISEEAKLVSFFHKVSNARSSLVDYSSIFHVQDTIPTYRPILDQIADDIFNNEANKNLNDMGFASSSASIKSLIKTSFNYFMPASKPKPSDCSTLIFFVLGGITPGEVKMIRDASLKYNSSCKLYIGSNRLLGNATPLLESLSCS